MVPVSLAGLDILTGRIKTSGESSGERRREGEGEVIRERRKERGGGWYSRRSPWGWPVNFSWLRNTDEED
jgi:hypothetical protein